MIDNSTNDPTVTLTMSMDQARLLSQTVDIFTYPVRRTAF